MGRQSRAKNAPPTGVAEQQLFKKLPTPRAGFFYGAKIHNVVGTNGTWLEGEEFAYPNGGQTRRCYADCEDGSRRVVWCGIPDTAFSIPGHVVIARKYIRGYVTSSDEGGFMFNAYKSQASAA